MDRQAVIDLLLASPELMQQIGLLTKSGHPDRKKLKKYNEVAGFVEQVVRILPDLPADRPCVFLECSCGKSYLSLVLDHVLREHFGREAYFIGVDSNPRLVEKCAEVQAALGRTNMAFCCSRTIEFEIAEVEWPEGLGQHEPSVDVTLALHACDTATDEAIAKGVQLRSSYVLTVPCCQNQIRGQVKTGHALTGITEFGPLRYHFANILTEALRALILRGAGYDVSMLEIVPPTVTPKNVMILARKIKRTPKRGIEDYLKLRDFFQVRPKLEKLLPGVVAGAVQT